ncbi:fatty acid desaturase [Vannielia litorea]|uniref:fatty acid desaturase n=1 Tax=Vannielia litorea TaxID=1217970 RepID=UPI001FD21A43|nr:fatty acid desaturase [Vannielia litorea]MBS8225679.1 fatty acid desaturase [Vannielia litorea]
MDHKALLATLSAEERARLTARRNGPALARLAAQLGALALMAAYIAAALPLWWLMLLPYGIALSFLFTLEHECTHATPFRSRWLNEATGHATGALILLPFLWFRHFHFAHHRHTGDPARDPEIAGHPRPGTRAAMALYLTGWGYWRGNLTVLARNALGQTASYVPERKRAAVTWEARAHIAAYAALLALWPAQAFTLWLLPLLIGQPALRLYLLAEHGLCPPVANMLANTRTTLTTRFVRALAWNMPYHAEHHAYPAVPFHALPAFHEKTRAHLQQVSPGYAAFTRGYIRSLR